jgi:hypothetical protein
MTTISTPVQIEPRSPRPLLLAVVSAVFGAAIGLGAGTVIASDDSATLEPAPASASAGISGTETLGSVFDVERAEMLSTRGVPAEGLVEAVPQAPVARRGGVIEGDGVFDSTFDIRQAEMQMVRGLPTGVLE